MDEAPVKRKRGRPRKVVTEPVVKRPRGRPRKVDTSPESIDAANAATDKALALAGEGKLTGRTGKGSSRATAEDIRKGLMEVIEAKTMPKVQSLEELAERFNQYFIRCAEQGIYPSIEEMYGYTGFAGITIKHWMDGIKNPPFGERTKDVINNAKDYIQIFDTKMVIAGKLDFLTYCFRAKNFYGLSDKQEVVVTPNNPMGDMQTRKELEEHYLKSYYRVVDEAEEQK